MVLLCVWCVVGIGARAHQERDKGEREVHTAPPKVRPHARACAHTRPRPRRGVGERPHVRGSVERTASQAVAKTRCRCGQTRWPWRAEWPLQGIPSEKADSGGCSPISTNRVALFGLSCTRFYPAPFFGHIPTRYTLFWPPPFYLYRWSARPPGSTKYLLLHLLGPASGHTPEQYTPSRESHGMSPSIYRKHSTVQSALHKAAKYANTCRSERDNAKQTSRQGRLEPACTYCVVKDLPRYVIKRSKTHASLL